MQQSRQIPWTRPALRAICLLAAVAGLAGCVVYPAYGPYWRPRPHYYYP